MPAGPGVARNFPSIARFYRRSVVRALPKVKQRILFHYVWASQGFNESLGINERSPAYDHGFDAVASFSVLPITAIPSTREGNHIRTDMVLTKNLQWPVRGRLAVVNESIDAVLSCYHPVFCPCRDVEMIRYPRPLGSSWPGLLVRRA
jgi:hypothetical protein